jgi:sugar O-acyltransferase (sialic acid O-acetyltransferase NeuD family)
VESGAAALPQASFVAEADIMQRVAIFGAGGLGRDLLQVVKSLAKVGTPIECAAFLVDEKFATVTTVHGIPVFGGIGFLTEYKDVKVIVGIGSSAVRQRVARRIEDEVGPRFATLVHPQVVLDDSVTLGPGIALLPGLLAGSDASIGAHVYTHHHVHLGHDAVLGNFVSVASGTLIGGGAQIGEGVDFGLGAIVLPKVKIGGWSRIGAGSVVTEDVPENVTVVGAPARVVSRREPGWHLHI